MLLEIKDHEKDELKIIIAEEIMKGATGGSVWSYDRSHFVNWTLNENKVKAKKHLTNAK